MTATRQAVTLLIGLDDTDNLESCGTGFHARALGAAMADHGWGVSHFITRHQLLVSPLVAYTSHNSAACVRVETEAHHLPAIEQYCVDYLARHSAEGSDAGLCLVEEARVPAAVQRFGFLCKRRWVAQQQARKHPEVKGSLSAQVLGRRAGEEASYPLGELSKEFGGESVPLAFRYFQAVEGDLELPAGLVEVPQEVETQLLPAELEARSRQGH